MSQTIVHVIGAGTIGEPLIGLLALHRAAFGIDEVTFHKNTPHVRDRARVNQLLNRGARLAASQASMPEFLKLGNEVAYEAEEAIRRATVVIDCTPSGVGISNKQAFYEKYADKVKGFLAQGSEFGFGKMYARGINDSAMDPDRDQFVHIVSCNTHNLAVLLKTIGDNGKGSSAVENGRFVCLRRANDISDDTDFIPAPQVDKHGDARFGTHHARDAFHLFKTLGQELNLFSSSLKVNTQYMHAVHFTLQLRGKISREEVISRLRENPRVALTEKRSASTIFSFGREHGWYGRILSQTVVPTATITVREDREVVGFCFTPQDGNSLLSSVATTLRFLDRDTMEQRLDVLRPYLFQEL